MVCLPVAAGGSDVQSDGGSTGVPFALLPPLLSNAREGLRA